MPQASIAALFPYMTLLRSNLSTVQLAVANGTVTVSLAGGTTISAGGNGTNSLTLSGSQVDINTTLASLAYQGTLNYNGPDTLIVTSRDSNAVTDVDTVAITVLAVDDAPVNTVPDRKSTRLNSTHEGGGHSVSDLESNLSTVQLGVANGTVTVTLAGTATISAGRNATATLTLYRRLFDINATSTRLSTLSLHDALPIYTLIVTSRDSNAVTDVDTVAITVLAVDDAPVNTV